MSKRHVVLVGLMGVGKTSTGRELAARLDRAFVDTDELVEATAGIRLEEIWSTEGEEGFRARERAAVLDAAASPDPLVIACGGGAVLDPANRAALRETGFVVWLDASAEELAARLVDDDSRPLLAGGDRTGTLTRLADVRADAYAAVADTRVDTGGRTVDEVTDAVLEVYGR